MDDRLKAAFDEIHAEETLKEQTKAFLAERCRQKRSRMISNRLAPVLACLLLLLAGWGGYQFYFTPTSVISIDVNPSLELGVNRFDRVVSVEGYNDEGQVLAESLQVTFLPYTEAVEQVLSSQQFSAYLTEDAAVSIAVAGADQAETEEMLTQIQGCTQGWKNTHCYSSSMEEVTSAHEAGLSCGKYRAYLELQALDPEITVEEVASMTMAEIRALIQTLSGDDLDSNQTAVGHGNSGGGNGWSHGYGHGHGHGGN